MKINFYKIFLLLCVLISMSTLFWTCKKEDKINECLCGSEVCEDIGELAENWTTEIDGFFIESACFNPNSDDELVYGVKDYANGEEAIYIYNYTLDVETLLYSGEFSYPVKWGRNGWILFSTPDNVAHRIKSDGTEHVELNTEFPCSIPDWLFEGDSIICRVYDPESKTAIVDFNGSILELRDDSFSNTSIAWNNHELGAASNFNSISLNNLDLDTIYPIYNLNDDLSTYAECFHDESITANNGITWHGDDIYYSNNLGIFKNNITGSSPSKLIKKSCRSYSHRQPTVNASGTKLLFVRTDSQILENGSILRLNRSIVMMDMDGSNEVVVVE